MPFHLEHRPFASVLERVPLPPSPGRCPPLLPRAAAGFLGVASPPDAGGAGWSSSELLVPRLVHLARGHGSQSRAEACFMSVQNLCRFEKICAILPPIAQIRASDPKTCTDAFPPAQPLHLFFKPPFSRRRRTRLWQVQRYVIGRISPTASLCVKQNVICAGKSVRSVNIVQWARNKKP